jgi:prefoldin beta subunit
MASPDANEEEKIIRDYQNLQNQMRATATQIDQLKVQKSELNMAMEEVEKSSGKIFFTVGGVMVEKGKDDTLKEIAEKLDMINIRSNSLNKQMGELQAKEKDLRDRITKMSEMHGQQG